MDSYCPGCGRRSSFSWLWPHPIPGQNFVAYLLIVPIALLWCVGLAVGWVSRSFRREHISALPSSPTDASAEPLHKQRVGFSWLAPALIFFAAIFGAFALQSEPDGDVLHQVARLLGSTFVVAVLSAAIYMGIRPRTSMARARLLFATADLGSGFVLWHAFDDTRRVSLPERAASGPSQPAAAKSARVADRSAKSAKSRRETPQAQAPSESSVPVDWATPLSGAMRRHDDAYIALASKWDADTAELEFESMLTPESLMSFEGRRRNRERLETFETLLAGYLTRVESLQRDYRADVLAIHIPESEREDFLREFERAYTASVAETKSLNADFERVELEIARTILAVTDLMEREENAVAIGSDGKTLLFESDATAREYNALLKALETATAEEAAVMATSSEAFSKRTESRSASADLR